MNPSSPSPAGSKRACSVLGCTRPFSANGFCGMHDLRQKRTGSPLRYLDHAKIDYAPKKGDKVAYIPLTNSKKLVTVDVEDWPELIKYKWLLQNRGYAYRSRVHGIQLMHRAIMQPARDEYMDHANRNKLDNRRLNLRVCTRQQNSCNTSRKPSRSGWRGVSIQAKGRFRAAIGYKGKHYNLGLYENAEDAAIAYNVAAQILHGPFACLNPV